MEKGDEITKALIECIQKNPSLWDRTSPDKNNNKKNSEIWEKISTELGASIPFCKYKWKVARQKFIRYVKQNTPNKYVLYEEIKFLRPHLKISKLDNKTPIVEISDSEDSYNHDEDSKEFFFRNRTSINENNENQGYKHEDEPEIDHEPEIDQEPEINITEEEHESASYQGRKSIDRNSVVRNTVQNDESIINSTKRRRTNNYNYNPEVSSFTSQQFDEEPPMMLFFKSVLPDLIPLSSRKQRFFKRHILEVIDKLYENEADSN